MRQTSIAFLILLTLPCSGFCQSDKELSDYKKGYLSSVIGKPKRETLTELEKAVKEGRFDRALISRFDSGNILFDPYSEQITNAVAIYLKHRRYSIHEMFRISQSSLFMSLTLNRDDEKGLTTTELDSVKILGPPKYNYYVAFTTNEKNDVENVKIFQSAYDEINFSYYRCKAGTFIYCLINESSLGMNEGRARLNVFKLGRDLKLVFQRRLFDERYYGSGQRVVEMCRFNFEGTKLYVNGSHFETDKSGKTTKRIIREEEDLANVSISAF